jgi:hypothetical protein
MCADLARDGRQPVTFGAEAGSGTAHMAAPF